MKNLSEPQSLSSTQIAQDIRERIAKKYPLKSNKNHFDYNGEFAHRNRLDNAFLKAATDLENGSLYPSSQPQSKNSVMPSIMIDGSNYVYYNHKLSTTNCPKCGQTVEKFILGTDFTSMTTENNKACSIKETSVAKAKFNLKKDLVIFNAFKEENLYSKNDRFGKYYIETLQGIVNMGKMYEKNNILYGHGIQVFVHIFKKKDNTSVIFADYGKDHLSDLKEELKYYMEENSPENKEEILKIKVKIKSLTTLFKDHKYLGKIDIQVWQYLATDSDTLKELQSSKKVGEIFYEPIIVKGLIKGTYDFIHYQDIGNAGPYGLVGKMTLSKKSK